MAFIKTTKGLKIGDRVKTTVEHSNFEGYMEIGTEVTITDIGERGYSIKDDEGNEITEIGWII